MGRSRIILLYLIKGCLLFDEPTAAMKKAFINKHRKNFRHSNVAINAVKPLLRYFFSLFRYITIFFHESSMFCDTHKWIRVNHLFGCWHKIWSVMGNYLTRQKLKSLFFINDGRWAIKNIWHCAILLTCQSICQIAILWRCRICVTFLYNVFFCNKINVFTKMVLWKPKTKSSKIVSLPSFPKFDSLHREEKCVILLKQRKIKIGNLSNQD